MKAPLNFRSWLLDSYIQEMATVNFGTTHRGKDHTQLPTSYLQWMKGQMDAGTGNYNLSQGNQRLNHSQVKQAVDSELSRRGGQGQNAQMDRSSQGGWKQTHNVSSDITPAPTNKSQLTKKDDKPKWIWAKSLVARPEYQMPAANLDLAMKKHDDESWMFVILDPEEDRLVSRGTILNGDLRNVVKSQVDANGQMVTGNKPSDILKAITPKKEKSKGNTIPDERITDEQKKIDEDFSAMLESPEQSHMTVNALAGTGKTTVLKHLAWKYSKGQKWLYLVFNAKNKEEAKEEFPKNVQVETTNGWAGREVLGKNVMNPTDRIQDYSSSEKARLVADTPAFKQLTKSLNIPDQDEEYGPEPKKLGGTERSLWYTLRSINKEFKAEAVKLLGLAKSYAVDPRNKQELEKNLQNVMQKYDLNTFLDDIKENVQKNSPWSIKYLDQLMGQDFLHRDFSHELMKATLWLLEQVMPHASQDTFTSDADPNNRGHLGSQQKLGTKRDFDDDLWFSAIHANELKWPRYDVVLADEVQDFNVAQQIILKKLIDNGAKVVAVGDPNQAIYRFRGADNSAFTELSAMLGNMSHNKNVEHSLTKNFRSRKAVIDLSNEEGAEAGHVSNLVQGRPFKEGPGKIGAGKATKYEMNYEQAFDTINQEMKDMGEIKPTAFLARTNEPLVHASLKLMKQGTPFIILGKDIANDLNKHIDKIISMFRLNNDASVEELQSSLDEYHNDQFEKNSGKVAQAGKLKELKETTDAMIAAIGQFLEEKPDGNVFGFRQWLRSKFGGLDLDKAGAAGDAARKEFKKQVEENNPIILSTVHKSKGLQFQRVFILRDDLWPHPRSTRQEDLAQELNNKYIGRTRAEDETHVLELKGQPGYKDKSESEE